MLKRPLVGLAGVALLGLTACAAPVSSPAPVAGAPPVARVEAAQTGAATITPQDMYARVSFLASDALLGRDTPSQGLEVAAAYLASEYIRLGLEPLGENGSYYQRYPYTPRGVQGAREVLVPNIVAVLRGSDPVLRDEYVILSAHFDHLGVGEPVNGDSIYNGADDDASGTAALVEVAEAFVSLPTRPRRSVIFLHVSGEEKGLLGSRWYADHPTVPLEQIVANINVDMIGRNAPDSVVVIGKDYSSLGQVVEAAGRSRPELGLVVSDDIWPEERFFYRSDHYNFARKEIPALFFFTGVHEDYHQPSDEVDRLDVDKAARVARLIFFTTQDIANATARPVWDPEGLAEVRSMTRNR